jgi:NAD(P)-dependent dehydrogenase (short-subunit alcohol dehydrogenase family)
MDDNRKTILLTGASRGIGHATVKRFSEAGWNVFTSSREEVPPECRRDPNWTQHIAADLGEPSEVGRFVDAVRILLDDKPLDALVNNAGVSPKSSLQERLGELNFFTPLSLARGLSDPLTKGKGSIVNVTSIAGHNVHPFAGSAYSTSKAALSALTREMAAEFAELGVRVNAVAPGEINTAMLSPGTESLIPKIPLHRLGTPEDVASAIFYLCSPESAYVNGTEIFVTGGQHIY